MIVYQKLKKDFRLDILNDNIVPEIQEFMVREAGHSVGVFEQISWRNSLGFMDRVISDEDIPNDSSVAIEYHLPQTSKRVDFIITGFDQENFNSAVIVELKQWQNVNLTDKDGIVKTYIGKGIREQTHPSYQVSSY